MQPKLIDKALEGFLETREDVRVTLRDGSAVQGLVRDFDGYVVLIAGEPGLMLYRHSILKIVPSSLHKAGAEKPRPENARAARQDKPKRPQPGSTRGPRPSKPKKPRPEQPAAAPAQEEPQFTNPMAAAMQKWLKNQKSGG